MINDFEALAEFFYQMNAATCDVPQQPALGTNQTGSLNPNERRYFQYPLTENGLQLNIETQSNIFGWYSYSDENPNSAINDGLIAKGVTNIPAQATRYFQEESAPVVHITLQSISVDVPAEYVIKADEGLPIDIGVDETLEDKTVGADVTDAVVRKITRSGIFPSDTLFTRRVAFTETYFGEDDKTYRDGYHRGIWQVDEDYFNLTKSVTYPSDIYERIEASFGINWSNVKWTDLLKPLYSGLAFRLYLQYLDNPIPGRIDSQAAFWVYNYRKNQSEEFLKTQIQRLESARNVCEAMLDICVVMDGSASVGVSNFEKAKKFVNSFVQTFSPELKRVAFLTFGNDAYKIFDFQQSFTDEELQAEILNASYPFENTNTAAGLLMAVEFFKETDQRNGVPRIITTFTDGLSNRGNLPAAISSVQNATLTSFAIGITDAPEYSELLEISLTTPAHVLMVNSFDDLEGFSYPLNSAVCEISHKPALGISQTGFLNPHERRYFQFPLSTGIVFDVQSPTKLSGWYSYSDANPNSAVYDGKIEKGITNIPKAQDHSVVYITLQSDSEFAVAEYVIQAMPEIY